MVKLFAVFFKAVHGAKIVALAIMLADDRRFLCDIYAADRVAVGVYALVTVIGMLLYERFFGSG
jgi:hypothetical protein